MVISLATLCSFFIILGALSSGSSARILDEFSPLNARPPITIQNAQAPPSSTAHNEFANPPEQEPSTAMAPQGVDPAEESGPSQVATSVPNAGPTLKFYMHDILGGSRPSTRVVTGVIARSDINGIPFSQPNTNMLTNNNNLNNFINPTTAPLLTGLNGAGQTSTVIQNAGNHNNAITSNNQPFVTAGQLPSTGANLQKLMFGSITVVDDELTEEEELHTAVIGRAQGFYLASSLDGTSHTMALTLQLHERDTNSNTGNDESAGDTISLFGVHRTAIGASHVAVIGGTGRYQYAKGYATVETIYHQLDQHITDGVDTLMKIYVYLS